MTNNTFLENLVSKLLSEKNTILSETTIILPNKRAKIFLLEAFKKKLPHFTFAPEITSIEDFIQEIANIRSIDSIELLFEFYTVYLSVTAKEKQQTFEQFSNWGKTLLQDFNEIDRYLLDPKHVFSYLQDIEVIKRWGIEIEDKTTLIDNYLEFWKLLPLYYDTFYTHLKNKEIGYQGLIYREAVTNLEEFITAFKNKKIVFAGFNALNQAEEKIVQQLIAKDIASIYWDIDAVFLNDYSHDAGLFVRRFKSSWSHYKTNPFEWVSTNFSEDKNIQIIGTAKAIGQAKIVSGIINKQISDNPNASLDKVALVLGDENMLIPMLHSLPASVGSLNITMGYSSKNNPIQLLIAKLFKMHNNALNRSESSYVFYYKDVLDVLSNPIIESYVNASKVIYTIKKNNYTFITHPKVVSFQENPNRLFELLFQKWNQKPIEILELICEILLIIKSNLESISEEDKVVKTFLYSIYKVINKLITYCSKNEYIENIDTLHTIYKQVIDLAEVSFEGEPLSGLQIMGVLESRVLDFETVIITSLNEGKFPAGKTVNSFIPYDVKRELGLPTYKEKDAIYTYHFYHLLQRAKNIYLLYNTESDGLDGGEKSRFITQLEVEKQPKHNLTHEIIQPVVPNIASKTIVIPKAKSAMIRLKEIATGKGFSPSALTTYIRNPIQFYFQRILSIRESEEVEENIALNTLGTIIHQTLEALYKPIINKFLTTDDLNKMLAVANDEVLKQFKEIYKEGEVKKGKNLLAFEVAKRNVFNFLIEEKKQIENGDVVKILALETPLERILEDNSLPFPIKIAGNVDRIEIRNNKIRIIDYKTGKVEKNSVQLKDWNGLTLDIKNDKIIQLLCYAFMYEKQANGLEIEAGIISFKNMKGGFLPFGIKQGKEILININSEILEHFKTEIIILINEILNIEIPFEEKTI
ncbi:PD-(D/E)XK nuclease family protein [Flavobacterium psychrophilum]|uniref:PD-(D/E)XK nuclease family protein n=1 Tax=Flavobacterium psychrophilum TaxID=96345 RepID=UPI001D066E3A|nr:PD-(D/E)XK nuclease family protein [Flavobacterium psychrophilum]MCB6231758.1 PD-(D/E)XK nuclease family protein [Flavobacterium psychrophilum]